MATQQYLTPEDFLRLSLPMRQQYDDRMTRIVDSALARMARIDAMPDLGYRTRVIRQTLEFDFLQDHYMPGTVVTYLGVPVMVERIEYDDRKRLVIYGKTGGLSRLTDVSIHQAVAEGLVWAKYLETAL